MGFLNIMICMVVILVVVNTEPHHGEPDDHEYDAMEQESHGDHHDDEGALLERLESLEARFLDHVDRLDNLIKFYHPEWQQSPSCGKRCPMKFNLLDFGAVQWRFEGVMNGIYDLEFIDANGRLRGNMDFYEKHMYLWDCGRVDYATTPSEGGMRTWTFAKTADGFKLYCEDVLLLDYTYLKGACADLWSGPTNGFYFETPVQYHMLQNGMNVFWFSDKDNSEEL